MRGPRRLVQWTLGLCLLVAGVTPLVADERILAYDVTADIARDATVTVTETIEVRAEGKEIRRGIYRDFPTRYRDHQGNRVRVDFEVLSVERDGVDERWRTEDRSNGVRLYIGSADRLLQAGVYRYRITYRTNRQLGFFEEFDEFYWSATGNGWGFPIDRASVRVRLPEALPASALRLASYTGAFGATGTNAEVFVEGDRGIVFQTTDGLAPREGLTIAVGWPKGIVTPPTDAQKTRWFFRDNAGALVLLVSFCLILGWYLWAWNRKGRDPEKGVIIPRYHPPEGFSPAACRFVRDMGFHHDAFTAAVVSLGVKGYLTIEEDDKEFTLFGTGPGDGTRPLPSPGEQVVLDALLPGGQGSIELKNEHHAAFQKALQGLSKALTREYKGKMFNLNGLYALPAILLSVLATVLGAGLGQANPLIWFLWGGLILGMHMLFVFLLRAPTVIGRQVMDEIEGFQRYLETAEQDRLDRMRSPELTPEVFERFLPYAFALDVENQWVEGFERKFPRQDPEHGGYHPAWYHGNLGRATALHHIGNGLSSGLASAVSSAASPPGSSSGSGGGGFSGGGGGGGGGGGW